MKVELTNPHLLSISDLSTKEVLALFDRSRELKAATPITSLLGKSVGLLFEKPSLRTRVSFEVAIHQLSGNAIYLGQNEVGLGTREPIADISLLLSRLVDAVACRTYSHANLEELAKHSSIPIINALSDKEHPTQALADLLTIQEHFGRLHGIIIAYIGDGNNVANSLVQGSASVGASFRMASPPGYGLTGDILDAASKLANSTGSQLINSRSPIEAVSNADVVYTDVWTSMGQENETAARRKDFSEFQVTHELLKHAKSDAIFMHPMPAHYGEEVPDNFLEHPQSVTYDQAANKLYVLKALLEAMIETHG